MKPFFVLAGLLAGGVAGGASATAGTPPAAEAPPRIVETAPVTIRVRPVPLGAQDPGLFPGVSTVLLEPPDVDRLRREDAGRTPGPRRVGTVVDVDLRSDSRGTWSRLADGSWLWGLAVHAAGARGLRLRVRVEGPLPEWPVLVYDPAHPERCAEIRASAAGTWGPPVASDTLRLEYREPTVAGTERPRIVVDRVAYAYESPVGPDGVGDELPCHLDVTCYPDWATEKWAVGWFNFIDGPDWLMASGSLLNRTFSDQTPLFLTAEHCRIEDDNIHSVSVVFAFHTDTCNGVPPDLGDLDHVAGAAFLASDADSDHRLLGLEFGLPAPRAFLGWNANPWPSEAVATCIHHPRGSYKRIASGTMLRPDWTPRYPNVYLVRYYQGNGLTELGSSGSPVFDGAHLVRGVTSSEAATPRCARDNDRYIGRFDTAFPALAPFLDPVDPVWVDGAYTGTERGTSAQPFTSVLAGMYAVRAWSVVYIRPGYYREPMTITKPMTLSASGGPVTIGAAP